MWFKLWFNPGWFSFSLCLMFSVFFCVRLCFFVFFCGRSFLVVAFCPPHKIYPLFQNKKHWGLRFALHVFNFGHFQSPTCSENKVHCQRTTTPKHQGKGTKEIFPLESSNLETPKDIISKFVFGRCNQIKQSRESWTPHFYFYNWHKIHFFVRALSRGQIQIHRSRVQSEIQIQGSGLETRCRFRFRGQF